MISTKIVIDASQVTKTFDKIESEAKQTGNVIDNAFKVEVDTSQVNKLFDNVKSKAETIKDSFKNAFDMSSIANFTAGGLLTGGIEKAVGLITEGFTQAIEKGAEFEKQLNAVGAITGQSGEALDKIGQSALELSKQFGGNVNAQLGAFQGILSKFGADLAKTPEALNEVTKNVNLLAKAGGIDATEAMNSLTNVMLQFGVNVSDANEVSQESARFMNVLAASAQVGAAEIPQVAEAILQAGVAAKGAGLSLEETNAAIQRLAVGGKVGSEAGVGLRNVLGLLQKQSGEGDKILEKMGLTTLQLGESLGKNGLAKTLDLVKNGLNAFGSQTEKNQALMQLFGAENSAVAGILLDGTNQINEFTKAMTGTQSGVEQARVNMQGFSETMSRLKASIDAGLIVTFMTVKEVVTTVFDGIMIFLNNTVVPFFENVFGAVKEAFMPLVDEISNLYKEFMNLFSGVSGGFDVLNVLKTIFETLGQVVGLFIQIALQPLLIAWRGIIAVYRLVVEGVQEIINWFKNLANSTSIVGDFIRILKDGFFGLIDVIKKTVGFVGGLLEKFGLIKKDKPLENVKNDSKEIEKSTEKTNQNLDKQFQSFTKISKVTKKIKDETKGIFDFDGTEVIDTQSLSIRPKELTLKPFTPIKVESETNQLEIDIAKGFVSGFEKVDFTKVFKKKENAFDETLENDRTNLLTSLQKNELSYQDYANRLNEIDRQRLETSKEYNNEFINALNETLALSFANVSNTIDESLVKSLEKQDAFSTGLTDNITMAMLSITTATTEMALSGKNLLKSLAENTIKTARAMFNAYLAPLLAKEILDKNVAGIATFGAYSILGNSFLSIAEGLIAGFKDGVINLQGAGTSRSDSIPAMLSKGESVINARSTQINEPFLRYANNGGDLNKLFAVSMNTRNLENLIAENNMILQNKNLVSNVNVNNRFEVANSGINVKFKR